MSTQKPKLRRTFLRFVVLSLLCILLIQTSCTQHKANVMEQQLLTGIIVTVLFVGLIAFSFSDVDVEQAPDDGTRQCLVTNDVDFSFEMVVDGRSIGLLEPGEERRLSLDIGSHELQWYPIDQPDADRLIKQLLVVGDELGYYRLTLQPQPTAI